MNPPLLLPVPRKMQVHRGRFTITGETRIYLTPGCGDGELEAALELADAIGRYAGHKITVDRITRKAVPANGIGLVIDPEATSVTKAESKSRLVPPAQTPDAKKSLGRILEAAGLLSRRTSSTTLRREVMSTGLVSEQEILDLIALEMGMEKAALGEIEVTPELLGTIDPELALEYRVFPVRDTRDTLYVALGDPLNIEVVDDLERILGKRVIGMVAPEEDILDAIRRHYEGKAIGDPDEEHARTVPPRRDASRATAGKQAKTTKDIQASSSRLTCSLAKREDYVLRLSRDRVEVIGATATGVFYGVQTMIQLVRQYGKRLPMLRIDDAPEFRYRGFMLDVSRGRVPTHEHLKSLVHTLSHFKINMLQLYIEHTFHFRSHPEIGAGCDPLEAGEILELDRYCRSRHVELVPSLQSFGHMGQILSLPKFRHLAELVQFENWEKAPWPKRLHGMMITPVKRGTYQLLAELYRDFLPLFSSHLFNLNSDETWDLGKGQSAKLAGRIGVGRLYLSHIAKIAELARLHGRTPMLWADIIYQHPELIPEVPDDIVLLDWNYAHDAPFDQCAKLAELGRPFFICPGTSGWDQVFNDVWNATRNIRRFVAAGKRHGAIGVLNTDWGDCGHFNMPAASLHGAVLGAAVSWREGEPSDDKTFDRAFSLHAFDDKRGTMARAVRRAGSLIRETTGQRLETWPLWFSPLRERQAGRAIPPDAAVAMIEAANAIVPAIAGCTPAQKRDPGACLEISLGVLMLGSLAARAVADHRRLGLTGKRKPPRITYSHWARHAGEILEGVEAAWHRCSKPSNWRDVLRVFRSQIRAAVRMKTKRS